MESLSEARNAPGGPLRKALALIEELAGAEGAMSLSDLARRCGRPKSSVHRVLGVLTDLNLVAPSEGGFVLGDHLHDMTRHSDRAKAERLRRIFNPLLVDLQNRTRGMVALDVLNGTQVRYVELLYRHELAGYVQRQPSLRQAANTATGRALLAFRPDLRERVDEVAAAAGVRPEQLMLDLRTVRTRDMAVVTEDAGRGGCTVAIPVRIGGELPFLAISVASPERLDVPRTTIALRRVATMAAVLATARPTSTANGRQVG
ncbi:helix-turn-helix domain-containing protein [Lentzea sp. NPDC042327]|uniref:IclR family transcriptional regulator n=1 Tax=Lentzea sp. NPDC042327 TaxID=3154801 RepID=UPI0033C04AED